MIAIRFNKMKGELTAILRSFTVQSLKILTVRRRTLAPFLSRFDWRTPFDLAGEESPKLIALTSSGPRSTCCGTGSSERRRMIVTMVHVKSSLLYRIVFRISLAEPNSCAFNFNLLLRATIKATWYLRHDILVLLPIL